MMIKPYTIKDLREQVGMSQELLGWASGLSSVYISHIEVGKRRLTEEVAEKIAKVYVKLMIAEKANGDPDLRTKEELIKEEWINEMKEEMGYTEDKALERIIEIEKMCIIANDIAYNQPEEIQSDIIKHMYEKQVIEQELKEMLETGKQIIKTSDREFMERLEAINLLDKLKMSIDTVQENMLKLKADYKNNMKKEARIKIR